MARQPIRTPSEAIEPPQGAAGVSPLPLVRPQAAWNLPEPVAGKPVFLNGSRRIAVTVSQPDGQPEILFLNDSGRVVARTAGWTILSADGMHLLGLSENGEKVSVMDSGGRVSWSAHSPDGQPFLGGWLAGDQAFLLRADGLVANGAGGFRWISRQPGLAVQPGPGGEALLGAGNQIQLMAPDGRVGYSWTVGTLPGEWRAAVSPIDGNLALLDPGRHQLTLFAANDHRIWTAPSFGTDLTFAGDGRLLTWNHQLVEAWSPAGTLVNRVEGPELWLTMAGPQPLVLVNGSTLPNRPSYVALENLAGQTLWRWTTQGQWSGVWLSPDHSILLAAVGETGLKAFRTPPLAAGSTAGSRWLLWLKEGLPVGSAIQVLNSGPQALLVTSGTGATAGTDGVTLLGPRLQPLRRWELPLKAYATGGGIGAVVLAQNPAELQLFTDHGQTIGNYRLPGRQVLGLAAQGGLVAALVGGKGAGTAKASVYAANGRLWQEAVPMAVGPSPRLVGVETSGRVVLRSGRHLFTLSPTGLRPLGSATLAAVGGNAVAIAGPDQRLSYFTGDRLSWSQPVAGGALQLRFSPQGRYLLLVTRRVLPDLGSGQTLLDRAELYNAAGQPLWRQPLPLAVGAVSVGPYGVVALAFIPDIRASAARENSGLAPTGVDIFDAHGRLVRHLDDPSGITALALGDRGHLLYLSDYLNHLEVWATGR